MPNYLIHYGILGQKWGHRNGPPYPLSSSKMSTSEKKAGSKSVLEKDNSKWFTPSIKSGKDRPNVSPAEKVLAETGKTIGNASSIVSSVRDIKRANKKREDLSTMSDSDLQKMVSRMNLEKQYYSLTESETSKGEVYVKDILDIAGDLISIGVSSATLITLVKNIK